MVACCSLFSSFRLCSALAIVDSPLSAPPRSSLCRLSLCCCCCSRPSLWACGLAAAGWAPSLASACERLSSSFSPLFSAVLWGWAGLGWLAGWTDPTCPAWTAPGWLARCQAKASRRVCVPEFWFRCCCCCSSVICFWPLVSRSSRTRRTRKKKKKIGRGEGEDRREGERRDET